MTWFKNFHNVSISFALGFLLFLISSNGLLDYYNRLAIAEHDRVVQDVNTVRLNMQQILQKLNASDLGFRGYYILPTESMLDPYNKAYTYRTQPFDTIRAIVAKQGLNPDDIRPVEQALEKYYGLVAQLIQWRQQENLDAIKEVISQDPGGEVWKIYKNCEKQLAEQQQAILTSSEEYTARVMFIATAVRILLFALGIPTLLIVMIRLKRDRLRRLALFRELDRNNRRYLFDPATAQETSPQEKDIIDSLISNLVKAAGFISKIGKGQYEVDWEGLNEHNKNANRENLAGELMLMKEQMLQVRQEDKKRMWVTEGLSIFSELVRQNQHDIQLLSDKLTARIVKYLGANQASLFFTERTEQDNVVLQLYGCYAYDRKKWVEKTIEPGQGLVGQAYLEQELTYLIDVPSQYVRITSGLGEATPRSLIIVPLKFNEQVEGVLEIASFNTFPAYQQEFLLKIGEIIASAIITIRSTAEMTKLMQHLQEQSEEMRAQEEEMRQNMEELQATQEEMSRRALEYQQIIAGKDQELVLLKTN